jgi:hypothetical protein
MIHRDLCDPAKTKYYSPLRMQFHFVLSRYVGWDGSIPLTFTEIANLLSCNIQSVYKFVKKGIQEGILESLGGRLFLAKRVINYKEGYVKQYPFLESAEFKALSVNAQRFILYVLWSGINSNRPFKRKITTLYHATPENCGILNVYSRAPIYSILEEAKTFLQLEVIQKKDKEVVYVTGLHEVFAKQPALENQGEKKILENLLEEHDCEEWFTDDLKEEILKLKKHYVSTFFSMGVDLFSHALRKFFSLNKVYQLCAEGRVIPYLKTLLKDLKEKVITSTRNRLVYLKCAVEQTETMVVNSTSHWINKFNKKINELDQALTALLSKEESSEEPSKIEQEDLEEPFPFYNWLEQN